MADEKETNETDMIRKRVEIFQKQEIPIHVTLKNKKFYNGDIIEMKADYFMLEDRMLGILPIFFMQIYDLEPQEAKRR